VGALRRPVFGKKLDFISFCNQRRTPWIFYPIKGRCRAPHSRERFALKGLEVLFENYFLGQLLQASPQEHAFPSHWQFGPHLQSGQLHFAFTADCGALVD
jgi:hypothetical protein